MAKYSKLIGTVVGFGAGLLVTQLGLPEGSGAELTNAVMVIVTLIGTYFSPANA